MSRLIKLKEVIEDDHRHYPDYDLEPVYVDLDKIVEIRPFSENGVVRDGYCRVFYGTFVGTILHVDMDHMAALVNKMTTVLPKEEQNEKAD